MTDVPDILSAAKTATRTTSDDEDLTSEIQALVDSAKADLELSGISKIDDTDPLTRNAILTFCKAHYGFDNPDRAGLIEAYESFKMRLRMASKYTGDIDEI